MELSMPGLTVPHHLPKFAQLHIYCLSDAIQPFHPLKPSSPSALNLSQYQRLFQWVSCSHQMTKILALQHQSFQWVFRTDFPWDRLVWSFCPGDFQESSPAPEFEGINSLAFCFLYSPVLTTVCDHWEDHSLYYTDLCWQSNVSAFQYCLGLS